MIKEIFKERIAEQRQVEQEEAEKARKKEMELSAVLKKAEKDIEDLLKKAPVSAFKIPEGAACAVVIELPADENKGNFTKKYSVFTGYAKYYSGAAKTEYKKIEHIGDITLQFDSVVNAVDFSNMFKEVAGGYRDTSDTGTLLYFIFFDSEAE